MNNKTVEQYLFGPCSKSVLAERQDGSEYWETVAGIKYKYTEAQINLYGNIIEMISKLHKGS